MSAYNSRRWGRHWHIVAGLMAFDDSHAGTITVVPLVLCWARIMSAYNSRRWGRHWHVVARLVAFDDSHTGTIAVVPLVLRWACIVGCGDGQGSGGECQYGSELGEGVHVAV